MNQGIYSARQNIYYIQGVSQDFGDNYNLIYNQYDRYEENNCMNDENQLDENNNNFGQFSKVNFDKDYIINNPPKNNLPFKNNDYTSEKENFMKIDVSLDGGNFYEKKENLFLGCLDENFTMMFDELSEVGNNSNKDDIKSSDEHNKTDKTFTLNKNEKSTQIKKENPHISFMTNNNIFQRKYNNKIIFGIYEKNEKIPRPDNIRKNYKTGFFKAVKNWLDRTFNVKCKFDHEFVIATKKGINSNMLEKTLKEIIEEFNNKKEEILNNKNAKRYDYIFKKPIKLLFNEYFNSVEFEKSYKKLDKLKKNHLIIIAKDFVNFYLKTNIKDENISKSDSITLTTES